MLSKSTITLSLLTAILAPTTVYGAPVQGLADAQLDAREPSPFLPVPGPTRFGQVFSGPLRKTIRDVEQDLLTREPMRLIPKVHPSQLHRFQRSLVGDDLVVREHELLTREPMRLIPKVHPSQLHRFQRSLEDEDLVAREPIFGIIKNIFRGGKRDLEALEDLDAREWDDLVEREPIFGMIRNIFRGGKREFDELDAREPLLSMKALKNTFYAGKRDFDDEALSARELEELEEREPIFGIIKNIFRGGKRDLELAELSEREPLLPLLLGGTLLASSKGRKRDFMDSYDSEMFERQTDDNFIVARERLGSLEELD